MRSIGDPDFVYRPWTEERRRAKREAMAAAGGFWNAERGARAEAMWKDGATFQEISDELGASRSSVSGYIGRLRLFRNPTVENAPVTVTEAAPETTTLRVATKGMYRVIAISSQGGVSIEGEFDSFPDAIGRAMRWSPASPMHIYADDGRWVASIGPVGTSEGPPFVPRTSDRGVGQA
jgi:DNA-binding CsgD family transcriptional regulator